MLAIVLWALFESDSEILFSFTRANPILGAFVLPFRLLRHLNGPPLTGLFYWAPFIPTHFPASLISEAPVRFCFFFFLPRSRLSLSNGVSVNAPSLVVIMANVNNNCLGLSDGDIGP